MATLSELKAQNPSLEAEINALLKAEFNNGSAEGFIKGLEEGKKTEKAKFQAEVKRVAVVFGETAYPKAMAVLAMDVLEGKKDIAAFDGAITVLDAQAEAAKAKGAADETGKQADHFADGNPGAKEGIVSSEADYQAAQKEKKKMQGRE